MNTTYNENKYTIDTDEASDEKDTSQSIVELPHTNLYYVLYTTPTIFCISRLAPAFTSASTANSWPSTVADIRAVDPSYNNSMVMMMMMMITQKKITDAYMTMGRQFGPPNASEVYMYAD